MEIWKDIVGWEGEYRVSNLGNVRKMTGEPVFQNICRGWLIVKFYRNKKRIVHKVHKLVAEAFIKPFATNECTHHINGNKQDNRLSNLNIMTFKDHSKLHSPQGRVR